jgi:formylglycine-generating enzyme required for sulfatase activity
VIRKIRIFVSSPGDCATERALLDEAVERINRSELDRSGILLRTFAWEKDVVPRIGPSGQDVVDEQTPLCDIYVGIMSARFGGECTRESGTEQEFRDALTRFGDSGKPWILFYFNEQPQIPAKKEAAQEWAKVLAFREELETKGIVGTYAGARGSASGFFETIELHLRALLQRPEFRSPIAEKTASPAGQNAAQRTHGKPVIPPRYLRWLQAKCAGVDLFGLEPEYGSAARLQSVYVPLTTTWSQKPAVRMQGGAIVNYRLDADGFPLPTLLLSRFADESVYVPGPPGSGKSTFCRWVTWLACEGRLPATNLVEAPEDYEEMWSKTFDRRLPILVPLRECWQTLPGRPGSRELSRHDFESSLATWVTSNSEGLVNDDQVLTHLAGGSALVVLDGVDEVPLTHGEGSARWHPRALLLSGLTSAVAAWMKAGNRVLVTSRPHAISRERAELLGLPEAPLEDLDPRLQRLLIDRWFQQLRPGEEGTGYAADLAGHLQEHRWLDALAVNPLLLTAMCIVFDEGGRLPQDKHELYTRIVNTVLNSRYRDDVEARERARYRLQAIAYGMHTGKGLDETRRTPQAVVSYDEVDRILREYLDKSASKEEGNTSTVAAREELLSQSGLFSASSDRTAVFYHLSFQEFLAGQRLVDVEDDILSVFLKRAEVSEWHNTLSLLFAGLTRERAARLVTGLVNAFGTSGQHLHEVVSDCLDVLLARGVRLDAATEQSCRDAFLATMRSHEDHSVRSRIGSTLGWLGDPRFHGEHLWCLPTDSMLGFVEIPDGAFIMGRDKSDTVANTPQHRVSLPDYLIARYPVTYGQFAAFVTDVERHGFVSDNYRYPKVEQKEGRGLSIVTARAPNCPVVRVTWRDAMEYCRWLDAQFRTSWHLPEKLKSWLERAEGWRVTLPSEAEWERAARGLNGRLYPWGAKPFSDAPTPTAPVGSHPEGATPAAEGSVEDLLGLLQWTRSRNRPYPYKRDDGREDLDEPFSRMIRGYSSGATRIGQVGTLSMGDLGFRLAVSRY